MTISVSPGETAVLKVLGDFINAILPAGIEVIVAQVNRVAEPAAPDFVMMNPIRKKRLGTNVDQFVDAKFQGSIAGNILSISSFSYGAVKVGSVIFGVGVALGTQVLSGSGLSWVLNNSQTVSSEVMAAGVLDALQPTEETIQIDVHGPASADNAQNITTMLRDTYACDFFRFATPDVAPLHADDPKQLPFLNESQQYEDRWVIEACLQVNATVNDIPQQFFDQIVTTLIPADIVEPA